MVLLFGLARYPKEKDRLANVPTLEMRKFTSFEFIWARLALIGASIPSNVSCRGACTSWKVVTILQGIE